MSLIFYNNFMLTKKDIENLKGTFATKEEMKEELKKFATKEEMKDFKEEIIRHFDVVAEGIKNNVAFLVEHISDQNSKLEKIEIHEEKIENLFVDVSALKSRVSAVEASIVK